MVDQVPEVRMQGMRDRQPAGDAARASNLLSVQEPRLREPMEGSDTTTASEDCAVSETKELGKLEGIPFRPLKPFVDGWRHVVHHDKTKTLHYFRDFQSLCQRWCIGFTDPLNLDDRKWDDPLGPVCHTCAGLTEGDREAKRDCCPICGHQFSEVRDINICTTDHRGWGVAFLREELIHRDDDYAWVQ
jgi:hypothetical protein